MNKQLIEKIGEGLKSNIGNTFSLDTDKVNSLVVTGQNGLTECIKQFVMKNGSKEIEEILLKQKTFEGSGFQTVVKNQLKNDFVSKGLLVAEQSEEVADYASSYLVDQIVTAYQSSSESKDLDGICNFLGIDKNLLKMINSPMGKMFGKFF
jgi:hypothetical protein